MKALVQFSTGAGSAEVAVRAVEQYGADVVLITADTLVEDSDNWRFGREVHDWLGAPEWVVLADGRTPMQVGYDSRVVPNNRMAVCSRILKRELIARHIDDTYDPTVDVLLVGFDWTEDHRVPAVEAGWAPWRVEFPLMEAPYLTKAQILDAWRARGIEPPRLYEYGFSHANCGGACVRGGQAQWRLLLRRFPERYREWEKEEERIRQMLGKDRAILRDRTGGSVRPMTLAEFRHRLDGQPTLYDSEDWGACGCAMEEPVSVGVRSRTANGEDDA